MLYEEEDTCEICACLWIHRDPYRSLFTMIIVLLRAATMFGIFTCRSVCVCLCVCVFCERERARAHTHTHVRACVRVYICVYVYVYVYEYV
jgi:hypothetical protein